MNYSISKTQINNTWSLLVLVVTIMITLQFSCTDSKTDKLGRINLEGAFLVSDSIPIDYLIGKWTMLKPNEHVNTKSFIIDSSGFHNTSTPKIELSNLSIKGNKLILASGKSEHLISKVGKDTLTIYWNSGEYVTYIRLH